MTIVETPTENRKKCGDCSKLVNRVTIGDTDDTIGTRGCKPPSPHFKRVLSSVGCIDPDNPNYFNPLTLNQALKETSA